MKIKISDLKSLVLKALQIQYDERSSKIMADVLLFGQLAGRTSHGLIRLLPNRYGPLDDQPERSPEILKRSKVSTLIRGHKNPGMLVASLAMIEAIKHGKEVGFGIVGTQGTHSSSGCLTYYVEQIAKRDLVGIVMANTIACSVPYNGIEKLFGTNPIAFGMPSERGCVIFDMSTSAISFGDVATAKLRSEKIPLGMALDKDGNVTTDPAEALEGALLPFGNSYKGTGLAMVIELLSGALTNASFCNNNMEGGWGHLLIVFSTDLVGDLSEFKKRSHLLVELMRQSKSRDGTPIRIPGERAIRTRDENLRKGSVEIEDELYDQIRRISG